MKRMSATMVATMLLLGGCATTPVSQTAPWPTDTTTARARDGLQPGLQSTSLWHPGSRMTQAFEDQRARRVGDLVTVIVVESSEASRQATTDLGRSSGVDVGVGAFLGMPTHLGLDSPYLGSSKFNPSIKASSNNAFKGSGSTTRKESLKTNVSARVMQVLEDGNLLVEGRRQVEVNDEVQYLYVRGIARPMDISPANAITSASLADAQIVYNGSGAVTGEQRPGWLYRMVSAVWPF